jgi:hypothetical protein
MHQEGPSAFRLNNTAVLPRLTELCKCLDALRPVIQTIIEFNRFDKSEVGGIHGHVLSPTVLALLEEFQDVEGRLMGLEFDLLKVPNEQFDAVLRDLNTCFLDLDIRAVAIAI